MKENDLWHNNYNVTREAWQVVLDRYGPDPLSTAQPGFTNSETTYNSSSAFSREDNGSQVFCERVTFSPAFIDQVRDDFAKRFFSPNSSLSPESMYTMLCRDVLNW